MVESGTSTKQRLQRCALELFVARGFDAVTVEEVAHAVGVSHMTFYRHFPTKESVVLDDPYDPAIGTAVARQDPSKPTIARVAAGVLEAWSTSARPQEDEVRARLRLASGHPGLRARAWENNHRTEVVIVDALIRTGVDVLEARVAAGAVLGALTAALLDWAEREAGTLEERILRTLQIIGALAGGGA